MKKKCFLQKQTLKAINDQMFFFILLKKLRQSGIKYEALIYRNYWNLSWEISENNKNPSIMSFTRLLYLKRKKKSTKWIKKIKRFHFIQMKYENKIKFHVYEFIKFVQQQIYNTKTDHKIQFLKTKTIQKWRPSRTATALQRAHSIYSLKGYLRRTIIHTI